MAGRDIFHRAPVRLHDRKEQRREELDVALERTVLDTQPVQRAHALGSVEIVRRIRAQGVFGKAGISCGGHAVSGDVDDGE